MAQTASKEDDLCFAAVVAAVNLAKSLRITTVARLKEEMLREGFNDNEIDGAIDHWAKYIEDRGPDNLPSPHERW